MPRTRKDEAPIAVDEPVIEGRYVELGHYTVSFESFREDFDPAPLFRGLPDDHCQCPHWGYVVAGRFFVNYADGRRDELIAGDAYYLEPGHLTVVTAGTEIVEFSPTTELATTMAVVSANMTAAASAS
jgi:hypothetical protein